MLEISLHLVLCACSATGAACDALMKLHVPAWSAPRLNGICTGGCALSVVSCIPPERDVRLVLCCVGCA